MCHTERQSTAVNTLDCHKHEYAYRRLQKHANKLILIYHKCAYVKTFLKTWISEPPIRIKCPGLNLFEMRTVKALASLLECAGSSELSSVAHAISNISTTGSCLLCGICSDCFLHNLLWVIISHTYENITRLLSIVIIIKKCLLRFNP